MEKLSITDYANSDPHKNVTFWAAATIAELLKEGSPYLQPLQVKHLILCSESGDRGPDPATVDWPEGDECPTLNFRIVLINPFERNQTLAINAGVLLKLMKEGQETFGRVLTLVLRDAQSSPPKHLFAEDLSDDLRPESPRRRPAGETGIGRNQ